jgi:RHS repeat-associated protein
MHINRLRRSTTVGLVATLAVSLAVATASTASAADGPSVQLPGVPAVPVSSVGQGTRDPKLNDAGQSARQGNQTTLPTSLPGEGSYSATSLSQSGKWDVSGQTGDFSWSYPLKVPPAAGGLEPSLGLGYSSSAVDGLTSATNNQASWVGDGWALWPGFVERTYGSCMTDLGGDPKNNPADLCWKSDNATLSLNGSQTMLIRDDGSGVWKPKHDNGSRIDRWAGISNGDDNGEHWRVTTTDGTQYFFGIRPESDSTWTVPVYGDDANEPCNRLNDFAGSSCKQAYRWQLDKVVNTNGDVMIYNYGKEMNKYGQNKNTLAGEYVRGGWLKNIEYGLRDDTPTLAASGRVVFEEADRCVPGATNCDWNNAAHRANFPDVPLEFKCDGAKCDKTWSPSFWTTKRLAKIRTEVRKDGSLTTVDSWTLRHEFPYPNDDNKPALWLAGIKHTGHDGGELPLPEVTFEGVRKPNRVVKPDDGRSFLIRFRIGAIVSESGAVTSVNYADRNCDETTVITPGTNTLRCFPAKWSMPGVAEPHTDYFHKYVVASVSSSDWIGSELSSETTYDYVGDAAWHYDESEFTSDKEKTWDQFRGYGQVIVRTGRRSDDPGKRTKVATTFYRGMNGDKDKPPAKVTDSEGGSVDDHNWLNGNVRETITYLGDTGQVVTKTISEPFWREIPTAKRGAFEARIVRPKITRSFTMLDGGGKQETKTESFYDDPDPTAMVTRVHDFGDVHKTDDDRCTTTTYARNTEKWLMSLVSEVDTIAVACGASGTFPRHAIANNRTTYDDRGNVTSMQVMKARTAVDKFEHITTFKVVEPLHENLDKHGRALKVADALGKVTTAEYTPKLGGPVTKTKADNALGFGVTRTLNPTRGLAVHAIDVNQRVTESAYDPLGRLTEVWLPGRARSDSEGNKKFTYKVSRTEPNVVTSYALLPDGGSYLPTKEILDGQLRLRQTQRPTDEGRLLTETRYDVHGRAFLKSAPFFTNGDIDDKLWQASNTEAIPTHTVTEFDGVGRATAQVFKAPTEKWRSTTTYGGNWTKVTPPPGGVPTTTLFDARGQATELRTDAPGSTHDTTSYRYTAAGQLSEVKDPENNTWRNEYDLLGRLVVQDDPDKGITRTTYNDLGQVVEAKDALGTVLRTSYDDIGRPKLNEQVFPDGRPAQKHAEWTYDTVGDYGKGLPASVTRWMGDTAYRSSVLSYDRAGRPVSSQLVIPHSDKDKSIAGTYLTTMRYNPDGSLQSTGLPAVGVKDTPGALGAETILHEYDHLGRIKTTSGGPADKGPFNYVTDTVYTKYGEPQQIRLGDDGQYSWISMFYEPHTRRPSRTVVDTQTSKPMQADINYTYNPAGLVTSIADQPLDKTADVQCFSYDHLQRLTSAWTPAKAAQPCAAAPSTGNLVGPAPYWQSFAYDKVGNRITDTQHTAQGDTVRTYNKGDAHKLKSVSTAKPGLAAAAVDSPTYDATGNTIARTTSSGATQKLDWDAEGRLAKVTEGGKVTEFVYGATGERLIRRDPSGTTVYLAGQELQVRGTVTTATRHYSHGGRVVASRSGDRLDYVATDHQGTVNTSIEVSSLKAERRRQLPFGGPRGPQGNFVGDKGFVGGTVDSAAEFTTLGARQYDPDTGRFLSVDPIGDFSDAQQLHGYTYSNNSPISKSDPSGLIWGRSPGCAQEGPCEYENSVSGDNPSLPDDAGNSPSAPPQKRVVPPQLRKHGWGSTAPVKVSSNVLAAWWNWHHAGALVVNTCRLGGERTVMWNCNRAMDIYNANYGAYSEVLAAESGEPSFWEKVGEVSEGLGEVAQCAATGLAVPGYAAACLTPSGMNFSQCLSGSVSLGVGASGKACIAVDDKGIGIVADYDVSANYAVGATVSAGGRYSVGDLDNLADASPRTFEVPAGRIADVEIGVDEQELKLHSLGLVVSRGKEFAIPMHETIGLPQKTFAEGKAVVRITDSGPLCRYCQNTVNWMLSPFK